MYNYINVHLASFFNINLLSTYLLVGKFFLAYPTHNRKHKIFLASHTRILLQVPQKCFKHEKGFCGQLQWETLPQRTDYVPCHIPLENH